MGRGGTTDLFRLLVAIAVADLSRIPLLVKMLDAVVAIVDHFFGDLALKAPAGVLAYVFFPATVAFLPLAPAFDAVHLADNALYNAEGVASIVSSSAVLDRPPAGGRFVSSWAGIDGYHSFGILIRRVGSVISGAGGASKRLTAISTVMRPVVAAY